MRVDEATDVLLSLRLLDLSMSRFEDDRTWFKWVIISLHSALQGAAVCHLSGTMNIGALTKDSAQQWIAYHNNRNNEKVDAPMERVADFLELMRRLRSSTKKFDQQTASISATDKQIDALNRLNIFRRDFTHFSPRGWSIETSGTKNIVKILLPIIRQIDSEGWAFRHVDPDDRNEMLRIIDNLS